MVSICMPTFNRPELLYKTLWSIFLQDFAGEVIVVDDGNSGDTQHVCEQFPVRYYRIEREPVYRNPSVARNVAYRASTQPIVICQSDDVIHEHRDTIQKLCELKKGEFHLATVDDWDGKRRKNYCSPENQRPFFFLGSLWRKDLYAVGGNEEQFALPGFDDDFFADCLLHRGLTPVYRGDVFGLHQHHSRPRNLRKLYYEAEKVYHRRLEECEQSGQWCASSGPWEL